MSRINKWTGKSVREQKHYISALDIGTSKVIAVVGEVKENGEIQIVGLGQAPSRGLKNGMVTMKNLSMTSETR